MKRWVVTLFVSMLCVLPLGAQEKEGERMQKAADIINEVVGTPEGISKNLLDRAVCVGVIPSFKKAALGIGGGGGKGAIICRRGGNGPWGGPTLFTTGGPSIGFQLGATATDLIFLVMNPKGAENLARSGAKLGADASVAAGPKGREAEAATDLRMGAEILSYSRSKGLFAGVSLEGAVIKQDSKGNRRIYGRDIEPKEILLTGVAVPAAAQPLASMLNKLSPKGGKPFKTK
ncbi:MAG: lipid-binding SYLF domain-containing protein [Acidobacteria bacterium]|nr:lipid-binding SYLF domain-containing protein [Acidobacteriota bacterium]